MIKRSFVVLMFCLLAFSPTYAQDIDKVYVGKTDSLYNRFMHFFGIYGSYALVIGVGQYDNHAFANLPSDTDAIKIKNYLVNEAGFDNVHLITGNKVTRKRIFSLMNSYSRTLTKKHRFLFYWAGHGWTDNDSGKKGYLVLKTSTDNPATMFDMRDVVSWDKAFKAKQTLYLVDACFSGIAAYKVMSRKQEQTIKRISRPSSQILTAGLENQKTIVINGVGGVFTNAVLSGLRGKADYNADGIVSARELEIYTRGRVDDERKKMGWRYPITPVLYNLSSNYGGDFYFVADKRRLKISKVPNFTPLDNRVIVTGRRSKPQSKNRSSFFDDPKARAIQRKQILANGPVLHSHNGRLHSHKLPGGRLNHPHRQGRP